MANRIDELNSPKEFDIEEYIENFFKPMPISEDRKEERKEASRDFLDFLLFILALISAESEYGALDWAYIEDQFRKEIERVALMYAAESKALNDYLDDKTDDFIQTTQRHDLSDPYWTSEERATKEAVNEANSVVGLSELQRAALRGAVKKQWRTERDNRVRLTHQLVDGKSVALDRMFQVGEALMRYPCDFYHSVRESVNCRCGLNYLDRDGKIVLVGKSQNDGIVNKTDEKVQYTSEEDRATINYAKSLTDLAIHLGNEYGVEITPEMIKDNLMMSQIGRDTLMYLEGNERNVYFVREDVATKVRGDSRGTINIYMKNNPNTTVTAQTLIHEVTHERFGIGGCQRAEVVCYVHERMHIVNRELTRDEIDAIVEHVRKDYDELPWYGGYGDYDRFEYLENYHY